MATDFPASPSNGDTHAGFTYNSTTGTWETSLSTSSIDLLVDVDTTTSAPSTGQLLQWNGTNWVPFSQIVEVDQYRLNANLDTNANPITTGFERVDDASFSKIGTGMSVSSGIWTFPQTGVYEVGVNVGYYFDDADNFIAIQTYATINDGTDWDVVAQATAGVDGSGNINNVTSMGSSRCFINVTNTSNVKAKFELASMYGSWSGNYVKSNTDVNFTSFTFVRVGDSQ